MKLIGLTGGIGSGKSYISEIFSKCWNIPIFYTDIEAKNIMITNREVIAKITDLFGYEAYQNNTLNNSYIAKIVFNSKPKLEQLNSIVHHYVRDKFKDWTKNQNAPYVISESAIMIESGFYSQLTKIISVEAPLELRIERVMKRDNMTKEQILQRVNKQIKQSERKKYSDYIIINDNKISLLKQTLSIHNKIIS